MKRSKTGTLPKRSQNNDVISSPKKRKKRSCHIKFFNEYLSKTSLHGFQYFGEDNRSFSEKLWWAVMIIASFSSCVYLIMQIWIKWDQNPVIVSFSESPIPISKISYPAVTICPAMQVNGHVYNYTKFTKKYHNLTENERFLYNSVELLCQLSIYKAVEFLNESAINQLLTVGPIYDKTFYACTKGNYLNDCKDFFTPILTEHGSCFNFNMLDANDIYKEDVINIKYANNGMINTGWSLDSGYKDDSFLKESYPIRAISTGINSAFKIYLYEDFKDNDIMCCGLIDGFKISFHSPNVIPRPTENFIWVPLNKISNINIKPKMMITSKGLRNYHPQRRQCYFSNEKSLRFFKEYTQENCELECLTNITLKICKCVQFAMPRVENTPICGNGLRNCINNVSEIIFFSEKNVKEECGCLQSCSSIKYIPEISHNRLNVERFVKTLDLSFNETGMFAIIAMYFQDAQFIPSKRSELYGLVDFLSNCGGLLGLCLGFSVLSLAEIIYFCTIRLYYHIKVLRNKPNVLKEKKRKY